MIINENNHSDIKLHDSIELEDFNREKMKNFKLNRDSKDSRESRPSDPENHDIFRATVSNYNGNDKLFDKAEKIEEEHEGVDDYEGDPKENRSAMTRKPQRSSLAEKYNFEGI